MIKAQKIEADLIYDRFSWEVDTSERVVERAIVEFEKDYWATREKTLNRADNYKYDYLNHFLYLPQDELLSAELLKKALLSTEPDSRKRRGMTIAYNALLKHFGIESNLNKYKGNYQPQVKRELPSIDDIDRYYEKMKSPSAEVGVWHHCLLWHPTSRDISLRLFDDVRLSASFTGERKYKNGE